MDLFEHGTTRGYWRHNRMRTMACVECLEAHRVSVLASRIRSGRTKALTIPLPVVGAVLAGETDALLAFLGPEVAAAVTERVVTRKRSA